VSLFIFCAPRLAIKGDATVDRLGICLNYSQNIPAGFKQKMDGTLQAFINDYNSENHPLKLQICDDPDISSMKIDVSSTKLVSPGKQGLAVVITALGTALPIIMVSSGASFYVWFAYLPNNQSKLSLSLSDDIDASKKKINRANLTSSPYFGSIEEQENKHTRTFYLFLRKVLNKIEIN
jgi:hypothetical protein